jgi:hypothetical protein
MREYLLAFVTAVSSIVALNPALLDACGEKLLVLGRSVRFQARHTPRAASVLLYLPQSTGALTDPNLESALQEAGHAVRAATTFAELETAVRSGGYDVVLANVTDAPDLQKAQALSDQNAVVLPAVYLMTPAAQASKAQTKTERENASKAFGVVVEVPGRPGHYCAAVDKAMELRLRRVQSSSIPRR